MSQVKVNSIVDASGGSNAVLYGVASPPNSMGFRNRVINGGQQIDQRNAGAAVTVNSGSGSPYITDRWSLETSIGAYSAQRSTTAPTGFSNSLQLTVSSTGTPGAAGYSNIYHWIEGFNWADMNYGTASAQTATLSFWVRSSVTGNFTVSLVNGNVTFNNAQQYTISSANTWTYVSLVFVPPTSGSNFDTGNGRGVGIRFDLGTGTNYQTSTQNSWVATYSTIAGSVQLITNASATWYITGVQLEAGTNASPFERRDYGRELMMCQRYFEKSFPVETAPANNVGATAEVFFSSPQDGGGFGGNMYFWYPWKVTKRTTPTVTAYNTRSTTAGTFSTYAGTVRADTTATFEGTNSNGTGGYVQRGTLAIGALTSSAEL